MHLITSWFLLMCLWGDAVPTTAPAPPGPHCRAAPELHRQAASFKTGSPLIGTTYFYWYDAPSGEHTIDGDGSDALTDHPAPEMPTLSYKSRDWHEAQLRDVIRAGIDFIMPVYWGFPGAGECWSNVGLPPLVAAHDGLLAEQRERRAPAPPAIGMFYDTSTLRYHRSEGRQLQAGTPVDLTTPAGRDWFYGTIRDFFSLIPPAKWARIDGRPIVFLYAGEFAKAIDERVYADASERFDREFGCRLFIVRHSDWPAGADAWYTWGGALRMTLGDVVAGLGPGYDHSAVPGRSPLVVERRGGQFYDEQWRRLLRMDPQRRPWLVHVETWNEWHEGTDVARSKEYGDQYIRVTAGYAKIFHERGRLESRGAFAGAAEVRWTAAQASGVQLLPGAGDGCWKRIRVRDVDVVTPENCPEQQPARYLYFDVDDSYLFGGGDDAVEVRVTFLDDGGCTQFHIDYDSSDPKSGLVGGAFRPTRSVAVGTSGQWRTERFTLPEVRFVNAGNGGDFRLSPAGGRLALGVCEVVVKKTGKVP